MSAVGITENAKGDNKKFEIWSNSREEVYIVQVCSHINQHVIFSFFLWHVLVHYVLGLSMCFPYSLSACSPT